MLVSSLSLALYMCAFFDIRMEILICMPSVIQTQYSEILEGLVFG